ncbi:MAG TPA: ATP-binding cassette domain-containing protein, partial [Acidobacteriota bacterium]|nr:ATP-binding cassette domain-containing protein [Acidobacteriota bacterium]
MLFYGFLILIGLLYATVLGTMLSRRLIGSVWPARSEAKERKPFSDQEGRYLVEVIHVKKAFDRPVLKGISLSIERGETIGVLGQSGTGKSVLL